MPQAKITSSRLKKNETCNSSNWQINKKNVPKTGENEIIRRFYDWKELMQ